MVSVTVHDCECECCQAPDWDEAAELREQNRILGLGLAELAKALGATRRENARLEAAKRHLAQELKAAYRRCPDARPVELWADSVRRELAAKRRAAKGAA